MSYIICLFQGYQGRKHEILLKTARFSSTLQSLRIVVTSRPLSVDEYREFPKSRLADGTLPQGIE